MWTGTINFGLVNIPVALYSGESANELDFDLLDKRDFSPVKYRRVNARSGREVPWSDIIKGYQYEKGEYVKVFLLRAPADCRRNTFKSIARNLLPAA
jgi:DNA end-binding protein Ku